ncbi:hypothetical protein BDV12DRAFT_168964 [Aspergillus spectabilis]
MASHAASRSAPIKIPSSCFTFSWAKFLLMAMAAAISVIIGSCGGFAGAPSPPIISVVLIDIKLCLEHLRVLVASALDGLSKTIFWVSSRINNVGFK